MLVFLLLLLIVFSFVNDFLCFNEPIAVCELVFQLEKSISPVCLMTGTTVHYAVYAFVLYPERIDQSALFPLGTRLPNFGLV